MKIGFVGFGNMASAMADGWIAAGVAASDMCACAGHYDALVERCEARGMVACRDAAEVVAASDIVVAAVKPYMIEKVFAPLKETLADKVVLSVAWTWDSAKWEQVLPGVAHISTVPNTPVSVGEGVIACEKASTLSDEQRAHGARSARKAWHRRRARFESAVCGRYRGWLRTGICRHGD